MRKRYLVLAILLAALPVLGQSTGLDQVESLFKAGRYTEACQAARRIAAADPENPSAWYWLGLSARENNHNEEALNAFQQALALKQDYAEAHHQLGQLHEEQRQWKEAIDAYGQAAHLRPEWAKPHAGLGKVYRKNGIWARAVEHYEKALELDPGNPGAQRFVEPCRQALGEQEQLGFVRAETLGQLAWLAAESSSRNRARGFAAPPTAPVPLHIEFGTGKHALGDLSANGREQLDQAALVLKSPGWQNKEIVIEGHTCTCGSPQANQELAWKRARTLRDVLVDQGAVSSETIHIIAYGEERTLGSGPDQTLPPEQCEIDELHSMDRRVVIREWDREERVDPPDLFVSPPATELAQVSFWYRPRGSRSSFQRLEEGETLRSGDELRIYLRAEQPIYAYIFHRGSAGDWTCLFPSEHFCLEAPPTNPLEPGRKYWLPRFGSGIPLDENPGQEETFVYLSPEPEPEMEKWVREGVPQVGDEKEEQTRGFGGVVSLSDGIDSVDWHRRISFQHQR